MSILFISPGIKLRAVFQSAGIVHRQHIPIFGFDFAHFRFEQNVDFEIFTFAMRQGSENHNQTNDDRVHGYAYYERKFQTN